MIGLPALVFFLAFASAQDVPKSQRKFESTRVRLDLKQAALDEALQTLSKQTGFPVRMEKAPSGVKFAPVTLNLKDVHASTVLAILAERYELKIQYRAADVFVSRQRSQEASYDITPLAVLTTPARLEELIMDVVDQNGWKKENRSIEVKAGSLIVRTTPKFHRQIQDLLNALSSTAPRNVRTEVRVVAMSSGLLAELRGEGNVVGDAELKQALQSGKARLIDATEILCRDGQAGSPAKADSFEVTVRPIYSPGHDQFMTQLQLALKTGPASKGQTERTLDPSESIFRLRNTVVTPPGKLIVAGTSRWAGKNGSGLAVALVRSRTSADSKIAGTPVDVRQTEEFVATRKRLESARIRLRPGRLQLKHALKRIGEASGVDIILDPGVETMDETPVRLPGGTQTASELLNIVLAAPRLVWHARGGYAWVTGAGMEKRLPTGVRLYPVADITFSLTDFPGPEMSGKPPYVTLRPEGDTTAFSVDQLAEFIKMKIADSWDKDGGGRLGSAGKTLVVIQSPEVHGRIEAVLARFRAAPPYQVRTEARVVAMSEALLKRLREADDSLDAGAEKRLEEALANGEAELIASAEVAGFNTQRMHAALVEHYPPSGGEGKGASGGVVLDVRPIISPDRLSVTTELRFSLVKLAALISVKTERGSQVQPRLDEYQLRTTLKLTPKRTFIGGSLGTYPKDGSKKPAKRAVLLLRSTIIGLK